ncbi:SAM-dependent methyltransferase, partial [Actinosynnema sp. NPDC023658]|uniref:SAM-dependent methyltransferase n=1 Tax=Actinosynnema sp. NPDC023658 TaxID=3155465 RepID=UPI0033F0E474
MERPAREGSDIDLSRPSPARVYDVHLGGAHNFRVDREAAQRITEAMPDLPRVLRANRAFLRRAVRYLVGRGITQFLDLGSGTPTPGNVHEVARDADPDCRVVHVDVDPVAVAHSRVALGGTDRAAVVEADLRRPRDVLTHPDALRTLDLTRPVGVLMFAVLHFVPDADEPGVIVREYLDAVVPGSYLALSHAGADGDADRVGAAIEQFRT